MEFNGKKYTYPLCDLRFVDKDSSNYQYIQDYLYWFDYM
ncbi:MAG: calcium-binding protein [Candidatus Poribacteria bacterium]